MINFLFNKHKKYSLGRGTHLRNDHGLPGELFLGPEGAPEVPLAGLTEADQLRDDGDGFDVTHDGFERP